MPDALEMRDYLARPDLMVALARERGAIGDLARWAPRGYAWFPYPKAAGGFRQIATADIVDWLVYRVLGFQAGDVTDRLLSGNVFANRLENLGAHHTRLGIAAWSEFRDYQQRSLDENAWPYTCVTDISAFYPSIDLTRLLAGLRQLGVGDETVGPLGRLLRLWEEGKIHLEGLPVGGQASGVLSNAYLISLDQLLHAIAHDFAMYGDDFAVFDHDPVHGREVLAAVDAHLGGVLRLKRNRGKTREFFDAVEAAAALENAGLAYLAAGEQADDDIAAERLYDFWEENVLGESEPDLSEMRFVLGRLSRRSDPFAVASLLRRRDLVALDPKSVMSYLVAAQPRSKRVADALCDVLAMPATPTTEAVHLHVCRYLAVAGEGSGVASATERIVDDPRRYRGPTRAMAVQARVRCRGWRWDDAVERAESEADFSVRRSLVGATKTMDDRPRTKRLALRALARRDRALVPTAAWAVAA